MSSTDRRDHLDASSPAERLPDVLQKRDRNLELRLRVCSPATVVSYDPAVQTAVITLGFLTVEDREDGTETPDPPIQLSGVRVAWEKSSPTSYDTRPLFAGATGLVFFADRALDEWYRKGGSVDPIDGRAHDLADAVFLPGLSPDATKIAVATDQTARVIESTLIKNGRNAADFLIKGTALSTALTPIISTLTAVLAATDPATVITLANANKAAILAALSAIQSNLTTKTMAE